MILIDDGNGGVVGVRGRWWDRIAARLQADRIDQLLAGGDSPEASVALAVRARSLTSRRSRRALAEGLERVMAQAVAPPIASIALLPLNRAAVRAASPDLVELRRCLLAAGPVAVRGVAQTKVLLTVGSGPLRGRGAGEDIGAVARRAIGALSVLDATMA